MPGSGFGSLASGSAEVLPSLPLAAWQDTYATLHRWTQMVGKIRLALSPMENHWWQVPLYLSARGMTTSPMPYGSGVVQIDFDFIDQVLRIESSAGAGQLVPLAARPVADFYQELMAALHALGVYVQIWPVPVEVDERIPFDQDRDHAAYDPEYAYRFWQVLLHVDQVLKEFRGRFCGKASPVHFFWGSFDLAATRFSGRAAPPMQTAQNVARYVMAEAYSKELSSCGFWPGAGLGQAAFYAYAYPEPPGYAEYSLQPQEAFYHSGLKEFILPYEVVRTSPAWRDLLLSFLQTTYEAAAVLADWDREALENSYLIAPG